MPRPLSEFSIPNPSAYLTFLLRCLTDDSNLTDFESPWFFWVLFLQVYPLNKCPPQPKISEPNLTPLYLLWLISALSGDPHGSAFKTYIEFKYFQQSPLSLSIIMSHLDYCNHILSDLPAYTFSHFQSILYHEPENLYKLKSDHCRFAQSPPILLVLLMVKPQWLHCGEQSPV